MALVLADNVKETTSTTGTTDWNLAGAVSGYRSFSVLGNGNTTYYSARDNTASPPTWEVGIGTIVTGSPNVLQRTTVFSSSNAGSKVAFANAPTVWCDLPAKSVALQGGLYGLTLSTVGGSATFGIAAGSAADSTNVLIMAPLSAYTKNTSAWAVGSGSGSLDTGAIANNTWYHVFLIQRPDTGVVDILTSLSASAPTLPANYVFFRRIGAMKTDGSATWILFSQNGDEFLWPTPINDINSAAFSTAPVLGTMSVPPGVKCTARFRGLMANSVAGVSILINSPDESVAAPNGVTGNATANSLVAGIGTAFDLSIRTNTSGQVRFVASAASTTIACATYGWVDTRGRLG